MTDKKFIKVAAVVMAATFSFIGAYGQSRPADPSLKFEVRIGASVPEWSLIAKSRFCDGFGWGENLDAYGPNDGKMGSIIGKYSGAVYSTGAVTAEFSYILKKWITFSAGIGYNHFWKDIYDGYNDSRIGTAHAGAIYFMPLARFTYLSHRNVKLYSGLGIGTACYTGYNLEDFPSCKFGDVADEAIFTPMLQTIPFGVSFGNRFFGFSEIGMGSVWCGIRAGIGYRF